jgi:hypothetical protein
MNIYQGVTFDEKIDAALQRAGGRLFLANLDRPALEQFVREILLDVAKEITDWKNAKDETMNDEYWDGYEQGMVDALVAVRLWGQNVD